MSEHLRGAIGHLRAAVAALDARLVELETERVEVSARRAQLLEIIDGESPAPMSASPGPPPIEHRHPDRIAAAAPQPVPAPRPSVAAPPATRDTHGKTAGCAQMLIGCLRRSPTPLAFADLVIAGKREGHSPAQVKRAAALLVRQEDVIRTGRTQSVRYAAKPLVAQAVAQVHPKNEPIGQASSAPARRAKTDDEELVTVWSGRDPLTRGGGSSLNPQNIRA